MRGDCTRKALGKCKEEIRKRERMIPKRAWWKQKEKESKTKLKEKNYSIKVMHKKRLSGKFRKETEKCGMEEHKKKERERERASV